MAGAGPSPSVVLAGATAAQAAVSFSTYGLPAIEKELRATYGLSLPAYGAVTVATLLGTGLSLILAGLLMERFGTRLVVGAGTALATASIAVAAFTTSAGALAAALFVSGIGSAVVPVGGAGALFRHFGPERRGFALGVRQMAVPLGAMLAALLMPPLAHHGGVKAALLLAAASVGIFGTAFTVVVDRRPADRAPVRVREGFGAILRAPGMGRLFLVCAFYIAVLQGLVTYVEPSVRAFGYPRFTASLALFAVNLAGGVARVTWGRVADRGGGRRRVRTLVEIGLVTTVGAVLLALGLHVGTALVLAACLAFGFGALGWNALVYVNAGEYVPRRHAAKSVSVAMSVVFLLSAGFTPPLGALADAIGWTAFWLVLAGIAAGGGIVSSRLPRPR